MTDLKRKKRPVDELPSDVRKQDYIDSMGIPQRVLVPAGETDLKAGIPVSLDLSPLYPHMPESFKREFYQALHDQGLVEAKDYFVPGAGERFRAAMLTVIRHDFLNAQVLAKEQMQF